MHCNANGKAVIRAMTLMLHPQDNAEYDTAGRLLLTAQERSQLEARAIASSSRDAIEVLGWPTDRPVGEDRKITCGTFAIGAGPACQSQVEEARTLVTLTCRFDYLNSVNDRFWNGLSLRRVVLGTGASAGWVLVKARLLGGNDMRKIHNYFPEC